MAETTGGDFRARWTPDVRAAAIADPARRPTTGPDITPSPIGAQNWFRERLPRFSKEVLLAPYMGKPKGEIIKEVLKEVVVSAGTSAALRIALTTATGASGGLGIAAGVGAGAAAIREVRRQGKEHQSSSADRLTLKEHLKSLEKKKLAGAIGKGAILGMVGFEFVNLEPVQGFGRAIGDVVGGAVGKLGELKGAIGSARSADTSGGAAAATSTATPTSTGTEVPKTATALPPSPTAVPPLPTAQPSVPPIPEAPGRGIPVLGKVVDVVGGGFHNVGLKAHEITGLGLDAGKIFVDHSAYFKGRVEITDSSPDWIKSINRLDGEYGRAIQGTVGESLPGMREKATDLASQLARERGLPDYYFRQDAIANHIQHIMEDHANRAFDSQLQQLVASGQDLNQITDPGSIKELGKKAFQDWLDNKSTEEIMAGANAFFDTENQIDQVLQSTPGLVAENRIVPAGTRPFDIFFPNDNVDFLRKKIPDMAAHIAANEVSLTEWWPVLKHEPYPAYLGELTYLVQRAEAGDLDALDRLKDAFKSANRNEVNFKLLTPDGIKKVLEILRQLG